MDVAQIGPGVGHIRGGIASMADERHRAEAIDHRDDSIVRFRAWTWRLASPPQNAPRLDGGLGRYGPWRKGR